MIGAPGTGKTTFAAFLAAQFLRYKGAHVHAFEAGRTMMPICKAVGGMHYDIINDSDSPLAFAPFQNIESDADVIRLKELNLSYDSASIGEAYGRAEDRD